LLESERLVDGFGRLFQRTAAHGERIADAGRDRRAWSMLEDLIRERYAEALTLRDLAGVVDLTPFQLIALFKRITASPLTPISFRCACGRNDDDAARGEHRRGGVGRRLLRQSALNRALQALPCITPLQWVQAGPLSISANNAPRVSAILGGWTIQRRWVSATLRGQGRAVTGGTPASDGRPRSPSRDAAPMSPSSAATGDRAAIRRACPGGGGTACFIAVERPR